MEGLVFRTPGKHGFHQLPIVCCDILINLLIIKLIAGLIGLREVPYPFKTMKEFIVLCMYDYTFQDTRSLL